VPYPVRGGVDHKNLSMVLNWTFRYSLAHGKIQVLELRK
jgi:hypothetical protein